jgi:hypothetical protein
VNIIAMLLVPCDECHRPTEFTDLTTVDTRRLCADCMAALLGDPDEAGETSDEWTESD